MASTVQLKLCKLAMYTNVADYMFIPMLHPSKYCKCHKTVAYHVVWHEHAIAHLQTRATINMT